MTHVYTVDAAGQRARLIAPIYDTEMLAGSGKHPSPKNALAAVVALGAADASKNKASRIRARATGNKDRLARRERYVESSKAGHVKL